MDGLLIENRMASTSSSRQIGCDDEIKRTNHPIDDQRGNKPNIRPTSLYTAFSINTNHHPLPPTVKSQTENIKTNLIYRYPSHIGHFRNHRYGRFRILAEERTRSHTPRLAYVWVWVGVI